MALARNLRKDNKKRSTDSKDIKKWLIFGLVFCALFAGAYGIINLKRVASGDEGRAELKMVTGDRPLPTEIPIWVTADGGLFMRSTPDPKGKIIILVPRGTNLSATELKGDWYKVTYMDKAGWLNKNYVTTQAPKEEPTKNWKTFLSKDYGYSLRYPSDWVSQDYGANPASGSIGYVGFGPQLSPTLSPSFLPPVIARVVSKTKESVEKSFLEMSGSVKEEVLVSGFSASRFVFNSAQGVQMTAYVIPKATNVIIIEETGGFSEDLSLIMSNFTLL